MLSGVHPSETHSGAINPVCVSSNVASAATNSIRSDIGRPRLVACPVGDVHRRGRAVVRGVAHLLQDVAVAGEGRLRFPEDLPRAGLEVEQPGHGRLQVGDERQQSLTPAGLGLVR